MTELTAEQEINAHLKSRLETFQAFDTIAQGDATPAAIDTLGLASDLDSDELVDQAQDMLHSLPLSVERLVVYKILLSTGGPADWLEVFVDPEDANVDRIVYHYADWFDHADRTLVDDEFDRAVTFVNNFVEKLM